LASRCDGIDEGSRRVGQIVEGSGKDASRIDGGMVSIGNGNQVLLSDEVLEEEFGLIGDEEFILSSSDDQLGHIDKSVVVDGILNVGDVLELGFVDLSSDSVVDVILEGESPVSVASEDR